MKAARPWTRVILMALLTSGAGPVLARAQDERIYQADEVTELPSLASPQRAARLIQESYPTRLQSRGIGGSVRLLLVIETDGRVNRDNITVVAATIRRLGEAASDAVRSIRFHPGKVDGQAVRTAVEFPVVYRSR